MFLSQAKAFWGIKSQIAGQRPSLPDRAPKQDERTINPQLPCCAMPLFFEYIFILKFGTQVLNYVFSQPRL